MRLPLNWQRRLPILFVGLCLLRFASAQLSFPAAPDRLFYSNLSSELALGAHDVNADGFADLIRIGSDNRLYIDLQSPTDSTFSGFSLPLPAAEYSCLAAADLNRDGYTDLAVGSADGTLLLLTGRFDNSFDTQVLTTGAATFQTVHWVDLNRDGLLDLFATNDSGANQVFRATTATTLVADTTLFVAPPLDTVFQSGNRAARWTDIDLDGDLDLYLCRRATDSTILGSGRNLLYINQGNGTFTEEADAFGLADTLNSWAAEFGDLDNDGDLDAYLINENGPNRLLRQGANGFTDITANALPAIISGGKQVFLADFNHDRYLDLLIAGISGGFRVYVFVSLDNYVEFTGALPFLSGNTATVGRLNKDPFLDAIVGLPSPENDQLALNSANTNTQFATVRLQGVQSNASGIGAQARLHGSWGVQTRELQSSNSHGIVQPAEFNFGLGSATSIDSLEVFWPSGIRSRIIGPPVDSVITLSERSNCAGGVSFDVESDGLALRFLNTSTNGDTARLWTFGDGANSIDRNPQHTYTEPGTYEVCLQSSGICGEFIECSNITVSCRPVAVAFDFTINGLTIEFTNTGTGTERGSNFWTFGDNNTSTETSPTHTYAMPGVYEVCLSTTDDCGPDLLCQNISIACPTPTADFNFTTDLLTGTFTDASTAAGGIVAWRWAFGQVGTSDAQNPSYQFPEPGTYEVCLTAFSDCDSTQSCQQVSVDCGAPRIGFTTVRDGLSVRFEPTIEGVVDSLEWVLGDGTNLRSDTAFTYQYASPNDYLVCILASSPCGNSQACEQVVVGCSPPQAAFSLEIDRLTVILTDETTDVIDTYNYTFGDGSSTSGANVTHTYVTPGTYTICQTISNVCGMDQVCDTITLSCIPEMAVFSSEIDGPIVDFANGNERATSFLWTFGDGTTSTESDPQHEYQQTGTYEVCLITSEPCGSDTTCSQIAIGCLLPEPSFLFNVQGRVLTVDATALADTLSPSWTFGDGGVASERVVSYPYSENGTYEVCLAVMNDCGPVEICETITIDCPQPAVDYQIMSSGLIVDIVGIDTTDAQFTWTFGDGTTSNEASPRHEYNTEGTYEICLSLITSCDEIESCQTVTLDCPLPFVSFATQIVGLQVFLTNTTTEGGLNRSWDFGDGRIGMSENPQHTYQEPGFYEICLSESNSCGRDTFCQTVAVGCNAISASFTFVSTELDVSFTADANVSENATFNWTFGDDSDEVEMRNPNHEYELPGSYEVCLTVEDNCGEITACQTIDVSCSPPVASFTFVPNQLQLRFADQSQNGPMAFSWTFGDGTNSQEANPEHTFPEIGTYQVCLEVSSICGIDSSCQQIQVQCLPPETAFNFAVSELEVAFADQSTLEPTDFIWDFGDGVTALEPNPTHSYTAPGEYTVCLTTANVCGEQQHCETVAVSCPAPQAIFAITRDRRTVQLTNQSTGNPTDVAWDFGDGTTSNEPNPLHTFPSDGDFTICQTVRNLCGETTRCQQLTIDCPLPDARFTADAEFLDIQFSVAAGTSANWTFGDGSSSTELNPTHTYAGPGTYQVCVSVTDICGMAQICQPLTVNCKPPEAGFIIEATGTILQLRDTSTGMINQWQWTYGNGGFSTLRNPIHQPPSDTSGVYEICLTVGGICGESTICEALTLEVVSKVSRANWLQFLQLAPNPAADATVLSWTDLPRAALFVELLSPTGRALRSWELTGRSGQRELSLADVPAGLYLLRCRQATEVAYLRILIQ